MSFWEFIYRFAVEAPFLFFCAIIAVYYGWKCPFIVIKRMIRSKDIQRHGWPTAPNMDADGDLVFENKD